MKRTRKRQGNWLGWSRKSRGNWLFLWLLLVFLCWEPNSESDLAYYKIYAVYSPYMGIELMGYIGRNVDCTPLFHTGAYCLTAVDTAGNESDFSSWVYYNRRD